jgi:PAS domain S-box-containing protein
MDAPGSVYARPRLAPTRLARAEILRLRGLLAAALGALLVIAQPARSEAALLVVLSFALSDLALVWAPLRWFDRRAFDLALCLLDVSFVTLGLWIAGAVGGVLPASALLMALVVALTPDERHTAAGAVAVGAFHTWLVFGTPQAPPISGRDLVLHIAFLCAVALYCGYLARRAHVARRRAEIERLESRELRVLVRILETVSSSLDLHEVALTIVSQIASIIPAVRCSMLFVDPEGQRCHVLASHDDPQVSMLEIDLRKYPEVRRAIESGSPVLVSDVSAEPMLAEISSTLERMNFRSILVVPLTFHGKVLGTICLKAAQAKDLLTDAELRFCTAVARASANALQNALLHDRVREASQKLSRILDDSPDLILSTDEAGRVTEFNRGAERLLGIAREAALGRSTAELFGAACGPTLIARVRAEGRIANHPCVFRRAEGRELELELNLSILGREGEESHGSVWVGRDVSELKAAQLQLLQAKKLSTIGEVISGVAHELNNPLSGVLGFSQLLVQRHPDSTLARDLERIHDSALRCQKIVKNLLSFARVHKPERRYLGLNGILEKTVEMRRYQLQVNDIEIERELEPELPRTMLDYHQMQQVFLNLLNNAEHAMVAARGRERRLRVRTTRVGERVRVEFQDNGVGMDTDTLERVFDPFFTTKPPGQGTGLGLSVSYGIVREHGGTIWVESHPGQGTSFFIELPIREPAPGDEPGEVAASDAPARTASTPGGAILVVDDEALILDLMVDVLGERGYRVDTAEDGREACRKLGERSYDLVLTDVRMPNMNGIELYSRILATQPEMVGRFLFMTGDLITKETTDFLAAARACSIPKPLDIELVTSMVGEQLEALAARR